MGVWALPLGCLRLSAGFNAHSSVTTFPIHSAVETAETWGDRRLSTECHLLSFGEGCPAVCGPDTE